MGLCESLAKGVDCAWGDWKEWNHCTKSCGGGQRQRYRHVAQPARNSGKPCTAESSIDTAACSTEPCVENQTYCVWSTWSPWSACSKECNGGDRSRVRQLTTIQRPSSGEAPEGYLDVNMLTEMGMQVRKAREMAVSRHRLAATALGFAGVVMSISFARRRRAAVFGA